jgi:hypothetical protein
VEQKAKTELRKNLEDESIRFMEDLENLVRKIRKALAV